MRNATHPAADKRIIAPKATIAAGNSEDESFDEAAISVTTSGGSPSFAEIVLPPT